MNEDNKDSPKISTEDQALWEAFIQNQDSQGAEEKQGKKENFEELLETLELDDQQAKKSPRKQNRPPVLAKPQKEKKQSSHPPQLDRRTENKLRKGKMQIEARLDLHGSSQQQAYAQLKTFIEVSIQKRLRCVLVITGKGRSRVSSDEIIASEKGVLKQKVPEWLASKPFCQHVLKTATAHPKDGGSGALYLYLKRQR